MNIFIGILIPLLGTTLGAACVFIMKKEMNQLVNKGLLGFASGVMIAASVWSLIIPAIDMSDGMGKLAFLPAAIGVLVGIAFMLILDKIIPHLHLDNDKPEGLKSEGINVKRNNVNLIVIDYNNFWETKYMEPKWLEWAKQPQSIAQAGLTYSKDIYDLERV